MDMAKRHIVCGELEGRRGLRLADAATEGESASSERLGQRPRKQAEMGDFLTEYAIATHR